MTLEEKLRQALAEQSCLPRTVACYLGWGARAGPLLPSLE
jgi:hypothetical protein